MEVWVEVCLKATPYVCGAVIAGTEFPSRLLSWRHESSAQKRAIDFAMLWTATAETVSLSVFALAYAFTSIIASLASSSSDKMESASIAGIILLVISLMLLCAAMAFLTRDLASPRDVVVLKGAISYSTLLRVARIAGVLLPGIVDVVVHSLARSGRVPELLKP